MPQRVISSLDLLHRLRDIGYFYIDVNILPFDRNLRALFGDMADVIANREPDEMV